MVGFKKLKDHLAVISDIVYLDEDVTADILQQLGVTKEDVRLEYDECHGRTYVYKK